VLHKTRLASEVIDSSHSIDYLGQEYAVRRIWCQCINIEDKRLFKSSQSISQNFLRGGKKGAFSGICDACHSWESRLDLS